MAERARFELAGAFRVFTVRTYNVFAMTYTIANDLELLRMLC